MPGAPADYRWNGSDLDSDCGPNTCSDPRNWQKRRTRRDETRCADVQTLTTAGPSVPLVCDSVYTVDGSRLWTKDLGIERGHLTPTDFSVQAVTTPEPWFESVTWCNCCKYKKKKKIKGKLSSIILTCWKSSRSQIKAARLNILDQQWLKQIHAFGRDYHPNELMETCHRSCSSPLSFGGILASFS